MGALKDGVDTRLARRLAGELTRAWPAFPRRRFTHCITAALEPLELLARVDLLTDRLVATLPDAFPDASTVLWAALESDTFSGWMTLPCGMYVARAGIDHPDTALALLAGLTPRWSSEAPIRPFIETHPDVTYAQLRRWTSDPDEHVRRLVSEGTRPRLPWAPRLRSLVADPAPNVELLDRLVDDPSNYVRRSVGNHLNDIAKDHPGLAIDLAARWQPRSDRAAWAVRHGLRGLAKQGNPDALVLLGVSTEAPIELTGLSIDESTIVIGDTATFRFTISLPSTAAAPTDVMVDYRVHYQGAKGPNAPKVFKLTRRRLDPGESQTLARRHRFDHVSIRRIRPGPHVIDVQLNGRVAGSATLDVVE